MKISEFQYRNAQETVDYIEGIKQELAQLLLSKTKLLYSGIHIPTADYNHATECMAEVIDDLFISHQREATRIIERWEQQ